MKLNFYTQLSLHVALAFAAGLADNTKASAEQKAAAEKLILAGDEFITAFSA